MLNSGTLAKEFVSGLLDAGLGDLIVNFQAGDWSVLPWGSGAWE
jgi:hypothetical protein